jgi:hypothetical protein
MDHVIDSIVDHALKSIERNVSVMRSHFNYDGLWFVDKDVAADMTSKVEFVAKHSFSSSQLSEILKTTKYPKIVSPILKGIVHDGHAPLAKPLPVFSDEELSKGAKALFPFLLNSLSHGKAPLACFESPKGKRQWFACFDSSQTVVGAIGYNGKRIGLNVEGLIGMQYRRIDGPQDELGVLCRDDLETKDPNDVRTIAMQIGKSVLPAVNARYADAMLTRFLSKVTEVSPTAKPSNRNEIASIKQK